MKTVSILSIAVVGVAALACANLSNNNATTGVDVSPQTTAKWQKKAPQLFNNAGYSRLIESSVQLNKRVSESQAGLIGIITNPFGIRDDTLNYILVNIPENNVNSRIAAIKMAYYDQQMIGVTDDNKLNQLANKVSAGIDCLNLPMLKQSKFVEEYGNLVRNSSARITEYNRIEHLLNGHVISADFGINTYDLKLQCVHFLGVSE